MNVEILYEDHTTVSGDAEDWATMRSDGVQEITLIHGRYRNVFHGASLYWLYREELNWVAGQTGVKYDPNMITEIITFPSGKQEERQCVYLPDLQHNEIKLGWWDGENVLHS